jgi:hypothetical protein
MTEASHKALAILRNPGHFEWYLVPLLAFVLYVYVVEIERKNWHIVLVGLAFSAAELCWEMFNALILHFTGRSALWTAPGSTAYLILVGLNIEIYMMFVVSGPIVLKSLPSDKQKKILGLPNRILLPMIWGVSCAFVEVLLNKWNALIWEYEYWSWPKIYLVIVAYSVPFLIVTWIYDNTSIRTKTSLLIFWVLAAAISWVLFVNILKWI